MQLESIAVEDTAISAPAAPTAQSKSVAADASGGASGDFSQTNIQVGGVDEADRVKTDGRYLYYFNETEKAVFIMDAQDENTEIVKKINLPDSFYNVELYVTDTRLVIIAAGYSQTDYSKRGYYINRNSKSYTIVFDTQDIENPELERLYSSDGDYDRSRRIGDYVYVLSRNYFNYPYWNIKNVEDIDLDVELMLPKKLDISLTDNVSEQNLVIKDKTLPYKVTG